MEVKLKVSYDAARLVRKFPRIVNKLYSDVVVETKKFLINNTKKGLDINGNKFEPLSDVTRKMRKQGLGTYKSPISHNRPLIASKKMIGGIMEKNLPSQENVKGSLSISGYGVFHNRDRKVPKRQWFGMSNYVFKNVVTNKKLHLFRRQVSAAFKKFGKER